MKIVQASWISIAAGVLGAFAPARAQEPPPAPDLTKQPTLYVVGYAHLDTQWRWTYPQTIREYLANTLKDNFERIEAHPGYVFNFTGSRRYQFFQEYYPEEFARLKACVAAGSWFPAGSSVDENDSNMPSAESLVRHVLYGNRFFRRELGVASEEYMLPDCFGFPASLPSVLAHCGTKGFSTQKLTWNAVVPIPFQVGFWEGPDGRGVTAALEPGDYVGEVKENLATSETWLKRIRADGEKSGVLADFHYYGTGDVGGAPKEDSIAMALKSAGTEGPIRVIAGAADLFFKAITPDLQRRLPRYKGELELTEHSAGSLTSEAFMKRINRKNELLADAAERASVAAAWLGGRAYPSKKLEDAWTLVLGSQMHDIISGTAIAKGYEYAWNDELVAANEFAAVLEDAAGVVAASMDTRADGIPLVVFNPLSIDREDVVEAEVPSTGLGAKSVRVVGPDGAAVPAQVLSATGASARIAFLARVPSVGFSRFDVRLSPESAAARSDLRADLRSELRVEERRLENGRYVVMLDPEGDVDSILDKRAGRELLVGPARLSLHHENPQNWPAWNQDWKDRQEPPKELVGAHGSARIVERGPARVSIETIREVGGSTFVQRIRLGAGAAGDRIEFDTDIDWTTRERSLRAGFPLTVSNPVATYDIQVGTIERGNGHEKQYEYGFQQWFDLTDAKGDYGVSVLCDSKYGADKPADNTVRLTLLHTPGTHGGYEDQGTQDLGRHHVLYALTGHAGDWRKGRTAIEAARLNQPMIPFRARPHAGALGASFSLFRVSDGDARISALKKAEEGDGIVVRLRELSGRDLEGVRISAARPILAAKEIDGQEREIGPARVEAGDLVVDLGGYELRAFRLTLGEPPARSGPEVSVPIALDLDADVVSTNAKRGDGAMDAQGASYPAEQMPARIDAEEARFDLGPTADGGKNALACAGQELRIPSALNGPGSAFDHLDLLAAADGDVETRIQVDGHPVSVAFQDWKGKIGQWDHRSWKGEVPELAYGWSNALAGIEPGFVKPAPVAWFATHHHTSAGDAPYQFSYLFKVAIDLPPDAKVLRLPSDPRVKILAATAVARREGGVVAASPLSDTLADHVQDGPRIVPGSGMFKDAVEVRIEPRLYWSEGAIRFTLDGSEPTARSTPYLGPFFLQKAATIRAAVLAGGAKDTGREQLGPVATANLEVHDVTPPTVVSAVPSFGSPFVRIAFSEPLESASVDAKDFVLTPPIEVRSVKPGEDLRLWTVELASTPEMDRAYELRIAGVKDASPAHNPMVPATLGLRIPGPSFRLDPVARDQMGTELRDIPGLPVGAKSAWTMNLFARLEKQPDDRTVIAGFGRCDDRVEGTGRYFAKFQHGAHLWSRNRDVPSRTPLELGRWQMLTATYDGSVLRLYADGRPIGERTVSLADDENVVRFAPIDPWEKQRRFEGEIREFTIWPVALGEDSIAALKAAAPR